MCGRPLVGKFVFLSKKMRNVLKRMKNSFFFRFLIFFCGTKLYTFQMILHKKIVEKKSVPKISGSFFFENYFYHRIFWNVCKTRLNKFAYVSGDSNNKLFSCREQNCEKNSWKKNNDRGLCFQTPGFSDYSHKAWNMIRTKYDTNKMKILFNWKRNG